MDRLDGVRRPRAGVGAMLAGVGLACLGACALVEERPSSAAATSASSPSVSTPASAPAPSVVAAAPSPPAPAPPPPILPFDDALTNAANTLFETGQKAIGSGRRVLLIDPLVDGASAAQTLLTQRTEATLLAMVRSRYPQFDVRPFNGANLAGGPLVLVGTQTQVNNAGVKEGPLDALRICLALADLSTGRIMAKGAARAQPKGLDTTPLPYYRDAASWAKDSAVDGYIATCQGTRPGDPIDPRYLDGMSVASLVASAIERYGQRHYADALAEYRSALGLPGGRQSRVLNGIYLSQLRLGRREEAEQAFGELVDLGLQKRQLNMLFLFRPGSVELTSDPQLNTPYAMWLRQIAQRAAQSNTCLEIIGHASKGGSEALNERLSLLRAQTVKTGLETVSPTLATRTIAHGVGSSKTIVGTGANNLSDAPDRRVEFAAFDC